MVAQSRRDAQLHGHAPGVVLELLIQGQLEPPDPAVVGRLVPVLIGARHDFPQLLGVDDLRHEGFVQHHADILLQVQELPAPVVPAQHRDGSAVPLQGVHDEADGGALPRPVLAYQSQDAAIGQSQVQALQSKILVPLGQASDFNRIGIHFV